MIILWIFEVKWNKHAFTHVSRNSCNSEAEFLGVKSLLASSTNLFLYRVQYNRKLECKRNVSIDTDAPYNPVVRRRSTVPEVMIVFVQREYGRERIIDDLNLSRICAWSSSIVPLWFYATKTEKNCKKLALFITKFQCFLFLS